jgi:5-methylcytosine-specific restriction endonuclease McrA
MSDFSPAARIRDPILLRMLKMEYDECEISGVTADLHLHHVIFKSHGGDDLRSNIICLTESVHTRYHRGDSRARIALARLVETRRTDVAEYIERKLGGRDALESWFNRHGIEEMEVA